MKNIVKKIISSEFNNGRDIVMGWCWTMPTAWTFKIPYVKELLNKYVIFPEKWIDPYAGDNSPAYWANDIHPDRNTRFHMDALDFVNDIYDSIANSDNSKAVYDGALYDPPYSFGQIKQHYKDIGRKLERKDTTYDFFSRVKNPLTKLIKVGGHVISFGWNHTGMGLVRGFEKVELLNIDHGGGHNCTCVTVEIKVHDNYTYKS